MSDLLLDDSAADVALIYPPSCDPTAPYLAVPMLTGFLRTHGVRVLPIDANIEVYDALLTPGGAAAMRDRLEARLAGLDRKASLSHVDQLAYGALWNARGDAFAVPDHVAEAKKTLRDGGRFYDTEAYGRAVSTIDAALRVISAAYTPLSLDFTAYRTPFAMTSPAEIAHDSEAEHDPFAAYVQGVLIPR
ncbi:MAG TPA: B12-binding domain-containing radical SAM protein, partial [Pseudomonadota bacterium]|nr:B12-binding domain-containing radical SAM protein [Pseudomonadota bacterium]